MIKNKPSIKCCLSRTVLEDVLTGAVWSGVTIWLTSLLVAAVWLIDQRYHPFVYVYSLIGIPALTVIGTLLGALGGLVFAYFAKRQAIPEPGRSRVIRRLLLRGIVIMVSGGTLIVLGTIIVAIIEHRPVARLEALGGHLGYRTGAVSFPSGELNDTGLPGVIGCLNQVDDWFHLVLHGTKVTGDGLKHLRQISTKGYYLTLSSDQLDDEGLDHLGRMTNVLELYVVGPHVPQQGRDKVQQALPQVRRIAYPTDFRN